MIDGNRNSPAFNTLLAQIPAGWETNTGFLAVDQATARLIFTTPGTLSSTIVNTLTNAIVGTVHATQTPTRLAIDASSGTAYVAGAIGLMQAINLASATSLTSQTGVELLPGSSIRSRTPCSCRRGFNSVVAVVATVSSRP